MNDIVELRVYCEKSVELLNIIIGKVVLVVVIVVVVGPFNAFFIAFNRPKFSVLLFII